MSAPRVRKGSARESFTHAHGISYSEALTRAVCVGPITVSAMAIMHSFILSSANSGERSFGESDI